MMDGAGALLHRRTWQFKDRGICRHDDLDAQSAQGCPEVALIGNGEVTEQRPIAAQSATNADRDGTTTAFEERLELNGVAIGNVQAPLRSSATIDSP